MLELDLFTILLEILNFLALSVGLYYFLFRPVMKRVERRANEKIRIEREMRQQLEEAQQHKEKLEAALSQVDEEIALLMDKARDQIESERRQMLDAIHTEAEQIRRDTEADMQRHQKQELEEFTDQILNTLMHLSGELIGKVAPPEVHDKLVQEVNDYVYKLGKEKPREMETLRRSLGDRTPTVYIASARALNPDQQRLFARTFSALTDRNVNLELETQADLYGGVRVRVGDILVDNSIAAQLQDMRAEVKKALEARASGG